MWWSLFLRWREGQHAPTSTPTSTPTFECEIGTYYQQIRRWCGTAPYTIKEMWAFNATDCTCDHSRPDPDSRYAVRCELRLRLMHEEEFVQVAEQTCKELLRLDVTENECKNLVYITEPTRLSVKDYPLEKTVLHYFDDKV